MEAAEPAFEIGVVGGFFGGVGGGKGVGGEALDGGGGDAEHGFLETFADLDAQIVFLAEAIAIDGVEIVREIMPHVLHQEGGGNAGATDGKGVGIERTVGELSLILGDLVGLGVVGNRAGEGSASEEDGFDVGNGGVHQESEALGGGQEVVGLAAEFDLVGDRATGIGDEAVEDEGHHIWDGVDFAAIVGIG